MRNLGITILFFDEKINLSIQRSLCSAPLPGETGSKICQFGSIANEENVLFNITYFEYSVGLTPVSDLNDFEKAAASL